MNILRRTLALASMIASFSIQGQMVEFVENAYLMQAPAPVAAKAQQAAQTVGFAQNYEVMIPKKAGIQVNPWNNFVGYGVNDQTKNPYIIINDEWLSKTSPEAQEFLLARCFVTVSKEISQGHITAIPYILLALYVLCLLAVVILSRRPRFAGYNPWLKAGAAAIAILLANVIFMRIGQTQLLKYFNKNYDKAVIERTIQKTGNKQAAIQALEFFDASIKELVSKGEVTLKPHESLFAEYAEYVKSK